MDEDGGLDFPLDLDDGLGFPLAWLDVRLVEESWLDHAEVAGSEGTCHDSAKPVPIVALLTKHPFRPCLTRLTNPLLDNIGQQAQEMLVLETRIHVGG